MSWSNRCEACDGEPPPISSAVWRLDRHGDAVCTWSCDDHLAVVLTGLQRDNEATEVTVRSVERVAAFNAAQSEAAIAEVERYANRHPGGEQ